MLKSRQRVRCKTCDFEVPADAQAEHQRSVIHQTNIMRSKILTNEEEFLKNKEGIRLVGEEFEEVGSEITLRCEAQKFKTGNLIIYSDSFDVQLKKAIPIDHNEVLRVVSVVGNSPIPIPKGTSFKLQLRADARQQCQLMIPLGLLFSRRGQSEIFIMRYVRVICIDPTIISCEPESPYVSVEPVAQLPPAKKIVKMKTSSRDMAQRRVVQESSRQRSSVDFVPGAEEEADEIFPEQEAVRKVPLFDCRPPEFLRQVHMNGLKDAPDMSDEYRERSDDIKKCIDIGIDAEEPENYSKFFHTLVAFEDIQQDTDIRMYDKASAKLKPFEDDPRRFEIEVEGLEEGRPSILVYDRIFVREEHDDSFEYEGFVSRVKSTSIEILMEHEDFLQKYYSSPDYYGDEEDEYAEPTLFVGYGVRFTVSRKTMRLMYRALRQYDDVLSTAPIDELLMPRNQWPARPTTSNLQTMELVNKNIAQNPEQLCAVRNIVLGLHRPAPYVLFGPPGTGKTTTITEAIIQVYRKLPESRILIVTPSNAAANVVTEKLINSQAIPIADIYRLFGVNCSESRVSSPEMKKASNWRESAKMFIEVSMDVVMVYKIVACTLTMSGSLVTMGIPRGHFTHIFIDEAGHAMEPEALIPIAGLLEISDSPERAGGSVILSGDHLQLGPIIRSPIARTYGMGKSLLERIMETKPYCRGENNAYNPMLLTKLVRNFRSHAKIIAVPNMLFYDDELEACGDKDITHSLVMYEKLPAKGTPVIFHGVFGSELRESNNPSYFNPEEISVIVSYVRDLLSEKTKTFDGKPIEQRDIGIIAPYRKQVLKLRFILEKYGYSDITVGSTEEFQGQERLVMIISTVRCSQKKFHMNPGQSLGFLRNQKRFNVALTRAKALMIIVGDPRVLNSDYRWRQFIKVCDEEGSCTGETCKSVLTIYEDLFKK
ncbi:putative helicase MOV-10 [Galendromus occidentalis]|uniref:RNA helicase n=1 Tax=Galendromus occidentalis TaxID=34638 RepID=A0AAJ7L4V2_9ACAR|nr:putative helicase MOV-10 [Galendromus occidentalis]